MITAGNISNILGMSESSLIMRIAHFRAKDGAGDLQNYARLSKRVYNEYSAVTKSSRLKKVKDNFYLGKAGSVETGWRQMLIVWRGE
jgi:hypothetical protein